MLQGIRLAASRQVIAGMLLATVIFATQDASADAYFDWLSSQSQTMVATAYKNAAEVEADIKSTNNRVNPPVYDPAMNAARWTMRLGVASPDQLQPSFPRVSSGNLLVYWEGRWDSGFGGNLGALRQHKAFQLASDGSGDTRRIEIRTRFDQASGDSIAMVDARGYIWNPDGAPLPGQINSFGIKGETWTRFWTFVDFDNREFSMWMSDEKRGPVQLFNKLSYSNMSGGLDSFWFEFNTSQEGTGSSTPLSIWARNFVAMRNVSNVQAVIAAAGSGGGGEEVRPMPPDDLTTE